MSLRLRKVLTKRGSILVAVLYVYGCAFTNTLTLQMIVHNAFLM